MTEGGARLAKMASLYPAEDPRHAQAKCLRDAWALHASDTGQGAGVGMFAQYLIYGDPNFDCGLIDPGRLRSSARPTTPGRRSPLPLALAG